MKLVLTGATGFLGTEVLKQALIEAARTLLALNPALRLCFVSGLSADPDEKSLTLQGRIKGRTEKHLSQLSPNVFNFRPGFIRPANSKIKRPLIPTIFGPIAWLVDHFT